MWWNCNIKVHIEVNMWWHCRIIVNIEKMLWRGYNIANSLYTVEENKVMNVIYSKLYKRKHVMEL